MISLTNSNGGDHLVVQTAYIPTSELSDMTFTILQYISAGNIHNQFR